MGRGAPGAWILSVLAATLALASCKREARRFESGPQGAAFFTSLRMSDLVPGGAPAAAPIQQEDNAYDVNQGQQLFARFNCVGCHAHGGGGMGPPLMDAKWIYGSAPENVFASIVEGRPNGM